MQQRVLFFSSFSFALFVHTFTNTNALTCSTLTFQSFWALPLCPRPCVYVYHWLARFILFQFQIPRAILNRRTTESRFSVSFCSMSCVCLFGTSCPFPCRCPPCPPPLPNGAIFPISSQRNNVMLKPCYFTQYIFLCDSVVRHSPPRHIHTDNSNKMSGGM